MKRLFDYTEVKLFYIECIPYVVFSVNGKAYTRRAKIIDQEYRLCEFRFNNQRYQRKFYR